MSSKINNNRTINIYIIKTVFDSKHNNNVFKSNLRFGIVMVKLLSYFTFYLTVHGAENSNIFYSWK